LETQVEPVARARGAGSHPPRIYYAAGNGDVMGTYGHWKEEKDDPTQLSMTYSGQFYDLCRRLGSTGFVLSHDSKTGEMRDGRMTIRQCTPARYGSGPAPLYHLEQFWKALRVIAGAWRFRADVVVPASGACHWFPLAILPMLGIKVVPAFHCVLWPKYRRPGRLARVITALDRQLFKRCAAMLTASSDIEDQLRELLGAEFTLQRGRMPESAAGEGTPKHELRADAAKREPRIIPFLPTYRSASFPHAVPAPAAPPFRVLYAGRVVAEKGVFDLVKIAAILRQQNRPVEFDICGSGAALEEMKQQAAAQNLAMHFHGHCNRPTMVEKFRNAHAVIVPTTTGFVEGFNQVVAEGILAGRPVVTSDVCPAIKYVGDAAVVVPPDNVPAYADALARLSDDAAFYKHCVAACAVAREKFFDEAQGWGAALHNAIRIAVPERGGVAA
jgi:glycosyltransferase involved in cell wall biosynthesis